MLLSGKNATESFEDVGHSPDAREMQEKYLIGEVSEPAVTRFKVQIPSTVCNCV